MDEVYRALGDPTRLRIVQMLARQGEVCVCMIVEGLKMNQPAVSQHMTKLKGAGLVNHRKQGQWIYYSLNIEAIKSGPLAFINDIVSQAEISASMSMAESCCDSVNED